MAKKTNKFIITKLPKATGAIKITKEIQRAARTVALFHDRWSLEEIDRIKSRAYRGKKIPTEADLAKKGGLKTKLKHLKNEKHNLIKKLHELRDIISKKQVLIEVFKKTRPLIHIKGPPDHKRINKKNVNGLEITVWKSMRDNSILIDIANVRLNIDNWKQLMNVMSLLVSEASGFPLMIKYQ